MSAEGEFFISVTGSIEYANFYDIDNVYCKYGYHFGPDWTIVRGIEEGLSQMSKRSCDARQLAVWNFPLDIAFKSINPRGWPQLILSIYGLDFFGHDVIRGYGVCHLPMTTGTHTTRVAVYVPKSSSILQQFIAWFSGRRPELIDPTILGSGDGRERMPLCPYPVKPASYRYMSLVYVSDKDDFSGDSDDSFQRFYEGFFKTRIQQRSG